MKNIDYSGMYVLHWIMMPTRRPTLWAMMIVDFTGRGLLFALDDHMAVRRTTRAMSLLASDVFWAGLFLLSAALAVLCLASGRPGWILLAAAWIALCNTLFFGLTVLSVAPRYPALMADIACTALFSYLMFFSALPENARRWLVHHGR